MKLLKDLHHEYVFLRRIRVISDEIAKQMPQNISVLDIGCGDGTISKLISEKSKGISYQGIDIMARPTCAIPFQEYDGSHIPFPDNGFDAAQYVDVLHHVPDEIFKDLLKETMRVSKKYLIIKDHLWENKFDFLTLKFMDWVGNAPHGVKVIYNFKTEKFWRETFEELGLEIVSMNKKIPLYPGVFNWLFGRQLHFVAVLKKKNS
ncbi:MAG: class I SAM-dependent methyltransferase [Bacteroidia bacterium]|nr:class I SAM-dependent methyltransferase [Bacteroidia bacterium]MCC7534158.1 class I SAM-dependent methyltransferase [Bacteroidia bacterium]